MKVQTIQGRAFEGKELRVRFQDTYPYLNGETGVVVGIADDGHHLGPFLRIRVNSPKPGCPAEEKLLWARYLPDPNSDDGSFCVIPSDLTWA